MTGAWARADACGAAGYFAGYVDVAGTPYAVLLGGGETLAFARLASASAVGDAYKGREAEGVYAVNGMANYTYLGSVLWTAVKQQIKGVVLEGRMRSASTSYWFCQFTACIGFDLELMDASIAVSFAYMFHTCSVVEEFSLSGFDDSKLPKIDFMFNSCVALTTIYAPAGTDWSGYSTMNVFYYDLKLVGGDGTKYSSSYAKEDYARIDGLNGTQGYFTEK